MKKEPCAITLKKMRHESELLFVRNHFTHNKWLPHPVMFYLDGTKYTPDFYDQERNAFIEVTGTKQAYSANREKYKMLRKMFPRIIFEVRNVQGELVDESEKILPQL